MYTVWYRSTKCTGGLCDQQNSLQTERKGKTTLIVSHRLSAVHQADWIIVLDQGQIVEEGRASDLLAQEGWYYEQYQRQQKQEGE